MRKFESLIEELVTDSMAAPPMSRPLAWLAVGGVAALMIAAMIGIKNLRPDLAALHFTSALIWKLLASLCLALVLTRLVLLAAQPQYRLRLPQLVPALLIGLAFLIVGSASWIERGAPNPALIGYRTCLTMISALGALQLTGLLLWLRHGAPTQARKAGFLAGIASGAWASLAYSLYCAHDQLFYAATWYSLATLALGVLGSFLAPRLCKW
jgi:hypothetical protein